MLATIDVLPAIVMDLCSAVRHELTSLVSLVGLLALLLDKLLINFLETAVFLLAESCVLCGGLCICRCQPCNIYQKAPTLSINTVSHIMIKILPIVYYILTRKLQIYVATGWHRRVLQSRMIFLLVICMAGWPCWQYSDIRGYLAVLAEILMSLEYWTCIQFESVHGNVFLREEQFLSRLAMIEVQASCLSICLSVCHMLVMHQNQGC